MKNLLSILVILFFFQLNAQVGIGTTSPNNSSILDISSTTKGVLLPRLSSTQRDAITFPEKSLLIYNTTLDQFQYNSGSSGSTTWSTIKTQSSSASIKYTNTNTTTNINTTSATKIPLFGTLSWNEDTSVYTSATANTVTIAKAGKYQIICNISLIGINSTGNTEIRTGVEAYVAVNEAQVGAYASSSYIRYANGHNTSSLHINEVLLLSAGDVISIKSRRGANSGIVRFRGAARSNIFIKKIN